jgi:hypothetical protein
MYLHWFSFKSNNEQFFPRNTTPAVFSGFWFPSSGLGTLFMKIQLPEICSQAGAWEPGEMSIHKQLALNMYNAYYTYKGRCERTPV